LFKILKDKKYIQYSEFRAHSVFEGKQKLLKHLNVKSILNTAKKSMTNSVFRASTSSSKILNNTNISMQLKNFRAKLLFRARKLFKNLNDKKSVTGCQGRQGREFFP